MESDSGNEISSEDSNDSSVKVDNGINGKYVSESIQEGKGLESCNICIVSCCKSKYPCRCGGGRRGEPKPSGNRWKQSG